MKVRLLLLWALIPLLCGIVHAQTTFATITGTVTDSSGAVIPNAKVSATNDATGVTFSTVTNTAGTYTLPQLNQGTYKVTAGAAGFTDFNASDIVLVSRDIRRIDVVLQVGATSTSVEVTAGATVIETETARVSHTTSAAALNTLPLNARWLHAFLQVIPNFNSGPDGFRMGGSYGNQANWSIDGTTFHDGVSNMIGSQQNYVESFQEVRVDVANNSAAFSGVGQLTVISKSGTNGLHGSAFDYYHTPVFRARNPFQAARQPGVYHLYGGSLSGPVVIPKLYNGRNKTFFFVSREGSVGGDTVTTLNPTVPIAPWRGGDFSGLSATIYDPASGNPFPNKTIPSNRINAFSKKYQEAFYPLPNYGDPNVFTASNYRELKSKPWDRPVYHVIKIDQHFSDKDLVTGRTTFTDGPSTGWESNLPTVGIRSQKRPTRTATVSYLRTFSPTLVNEVRWGMNSNDIPFQGPQDGNKFIAEYGIKGLAPNVPTAYGITGVGFTGLALQAVSASTSGGPNYRQHNEMIQNQTSWFRGRHTIMFGVDIQRVAFDDFVVGGNALGNVNFSNLYTSKGLSGQGSPYADFLLGLPTTMRRDPAPTMLNRSRWQTDFFFQDDFKVNQKLTLNLGLRYEVHKPWNEKHGLISGFDLASASMVVPDASMDKINKLFPASFVPVVAASKTGRNTNTLMNTDKNNFAPRIGFAYRPFGPSTVVRGGFSVGYEMVPQQQTFGGAPFVMTENDFTNGPVPSVVLPWVFPESGNNGPASVSLPASLNPNLQIPYAIQYNLTVEHQLAANWGVGVTYINTSMRQGVYGFDYNQPAPDGQLYINKARPFPKYSSVMYYTNGTGHSYNAFTTQVTRRMSKGLYFQTAWVFARDIGDVMGLENAFDRKRERGPMAGIPTHRLTSALVYELPFGKGKMFGSSMSRAANLVAGGWSLSSLFTAQTGQFLTPLWSGPDPTGTAYSSSATRPTVSRRPDVFADPNRPADQRTVQAWFDKSVFAAAPIGRYGTAGRGIIKGPGVNIWNFSVNKDFFFSERAPKLRWELSATNAFNHPNWSNPGLTISNSASAGVISNVGTVDTSTARALRMSLRADF